MNNFLSKICQFENTYHQFSSNPSYTPFHIPFLFHSSNRVCTLIKYIPPTIAYTRDKKLDTMINPGHDYTGWNYWWKRARYYISSASLSIPRPADNPRSYVQRLLYDALRNPAPAVPPRGSAFNGTRPLCAVDPGSSVFPPGAISLAMPRDINTLLRKDALMKVDKRSEKYVHQPSRRRRRRPSRRRRQSPRRVSRRGERSGGGSVHALRTPARPCCRSRAAAQGEGVRHGWRGGEGGTVAEFTRRHLY